MGNLDRSRIMQLAGEGKAEDLALELRARCFSEDGGLYYFTKVVLGYKELEDNFHLPLCNHLQQTIQDLKRGYLLQRGGFKSTIVAKSYPLWRLCGGGKDLRPDIEDTRNLRIALIGENEDIAKKNLNDPKWHLENNQMLKWLFPEVCPLSTKDLVWGATEFEIPRSKSFDEKTITAKGVGCGTTGFHYDIVIYDDIFGEKAAKSVPLADSIKQWFDTAPGLLNDQRTSEEIYIGTRWLHGKGDLAGYIMEGMKFTQVNEDGKSGRPFGFKWYIKSAIEKDAEGNDQPTFKSRFTMEVLNDILRRQKMYVFSCQYLNRPTNPEGTSFKEGMIKHYAIKTYIGSDGVEKPGLLVPDDGTPPVRLIDLNRISFYDPSSGGRKATCQNAVIALGCAHDRRKFVLKYWAANTGFRGAIEQWMKINDQFFTYPNFYEAIGAHKEVGEIVYERKNEVECRHCALHNRPGVKHRRLSPVAHRPPGGQGDAEKTTRILTYAQSDVEDGLIYLGPNMHELLGQITEFPYGEFVDLFDALAYAVHLIRPGKQLQEYEDEQRDAERMRERPGYTAQLHAVGGYG